MWRCCCSCLPHSSMGKPPPSSCDTRRGCSTSTCECSLCDGVLCHAWECGVWAGGRSGCGGCVCVFFAVVCCQQSVAFLPHTPLATMRRRQHAPSPTSWTALMSSPSVSVLRCVCVCACVFCERRKRARFEGLSLVVFRCVAVARTVCTRLTLFFFFSFSLSFFC